jgi:hypothetical protein
VAALPRRGGRHRSASSSATTRRAPSAITVLAGGGVTLSGTATIAQSNLKVFLVRFTNISPGTEAYTVYSLGSAVF